LPASRNEVIHKTHKDRNRKEKKRATVAHRFPDFSVFIETLWIFRYGEIKISVKFTPFSKNLALKYYFSGGERGVVVKFL